MVRGLCHRKIRVRQFYPLSDYEKKEVVVAAPLLDNSQHAREVDKPIKKFNVIWVMAAVIAILISVIIGLLL